MQAAVIIPARLAAERLPRKPLATLGELPLVVHVFQQASRSERADHVIVATDSEEVCDTVRAHGGRAVMTSEAHTSGTDRVAEVARAEGFDIIVNVQGDEPFLHPQDIDAIIETLQTDVGAHAMVTLSKPIESRDEFVDPNVVKVVRGDNGMAMYFSRAPIPCSRDAAELPEQASRHIGVYGYRRAILEKMSTTPPHPLETVEKLEQLRALATGIPIAVLDARSHGRGIDTPDDLEWARTRLETLGAQAFGG